VLAVGEHLWGSVDDRILRMSSCLAGGLGCGYQELCGALSGGSLLIGGLHGRTAPDEDDEECNHRVSRYREVFHERFGTTQCQAIRDSGYGSNEEMPCSRLVEQAVGLLLEVLDEPWPVDAPQR
jgi:C_GCAxxG_C_C family probable redox protein